MKPTALTFKDYISRVYNSYSRYTRLWHAQWMEIYPDHEPVSITELVKLSRAAGMSTSAAHSVWQSWISHQKRRHGK